MSTATYSRVAMMRQNSPQPRLRCSRPSRCNTGGTHLQISQLEQRTLSDSDSENLGSNPSSPARVKPLTVRKNLQISGRTNPVNRTTKHYKSFQSIFNELRTCPDFPGHMMGT